MAVSQRLYPRATVKKIVKAHSKKNLSKNVDVLVSCHDATRLEFEFTDDYIDLSGLLTLSADVWLIESLIKQNTY
jgi:hypothetical protein